MKDTGQDGNLLGRLEAALEANSLPKNAQDYARHLVNRLSQPVRVSVLGPPKAGKSQLVNMFLGETVLPPEAKLPTTEYAWGEVAQMVVTSADGSVVRVHGTDVGMVAGKGAAFLRLELPVPLLKRVNLLEVVTDGTEEELGSGVDWVVRRTDIALWCTQEFGEVEQTVWRRVPDSLKDHAFLVLTKADQLSAKQQLSARVSALETVVAEEFHSMFAVATLQAIRAKSGGEVSDSLLHASGGEALTSEVLRHAERGRRADFDSAEMFLARYNGDEAVSRPRSDPAAVTSAPAADRKAPVTKAKTKRGDNAEELAATLLRVQAAVKRPDGSRSVVVEDDPQPVVKAEEVAKKSAPEVVAPPVPAGPKVENVALFTDAVRYLKRRGDALAESAFGLNEGEAKELVDTCVSAVDHLTDLFAQDESGCEAADAFIDELTEAQELMILMQVEEGDGPAADAATLLLQLRRDMEMQLAA